MYIAWITRTMINSFGFKRWSFFYASHPIPSGGKDMDDIGDNFPRILVAGIGNRLLADDGFGPRVVDLLSDRELPDNVEVRDFGTAGMTIATDLDDYDAVIFIDSSDHEGEPGSLYMTRLLVEEGIEDIGELARLTLHEAGLEGLLRFSKSIGTLPDDIFLIGCKPKVLGPSLELSPKVEAALRKAIAIVDEILENILEK
jgi:hydrogenase maturation protease